MSSLTSWAAELKELAAKADLKIDQFINAADVIEKREQQLQASRRASIEDRAAIDACIEALDGALTSDMPVSDIIAQAGVPRKQGTTSYAIRAKRLALTHQPK